MSVTNACVGCHMQTIASTDPGFLLSGGHTFEMSYNVVTNGVTNKIDQVGVCNQCHGGITTFNFPVEDYANVGAILGVQTEVQILLNQLSTLLPNSNGVMDGAVQDQSFCHDQLDDGATESRLQLAVCHPMTAAGRPQCPVCHRPAQGVDRQPDWLLRARRFARCVGDRLLRLDYQRRRRPNADPAGDGIPNWLKYALGLNPLVQGHG